MNKKLYIHVGTPKTGTSAIQKFCLWNRELLKEMNYAYPIFPGEFKWGPEAHNGYFLTKRIKNTKGSYAVKKEQKIFQKCMSKVMSQFEVCDNVILSDENMWGEGRCRKELWTDIRTWAERNTVQVKIIIYLRRQDEYAVSLWAQRVKNGYGEYATDTLKQWIEDCQKEEALDYATRIEKFAEFFGKENIIVRKYDRTEFEG